MKEKQHHYETNPISLIIKGVKRAFGHSQQLAIVLIVLPFVIGVAQFVFQIFNNAFGLQFEAEGAARPGVMIVGSIFFLFALVLQTFIQYMFVGIQNFSSSKIAKSEDAGFSEALEQSFARFWKVLGLTLLVTIYALPYLFGVMVLVGINVLVGANNTSTLALSLPPSILVVIWLIVMATRVFLRFAFAGIALFDGVSNVSSALAHSKRLTKNRLTEVFGVVSISSMVPFIQTLTTASGLAMLYEQLTEARRDNRELPKQSILNYLGIAIVLSFVLFVGLIVLAIWLASS